MWNLSKLKIVNLFSYSEFEYDFKNNCTTIVSGVNRTDSGTLSNGSGKSSLGEVLCLLLTGNTLRKIKNKEIVRNGETRGEGMLELFNGNNTLTIHRTFHVTQSSKVEIHENGQLNKDLIHLNPKESDKYILSELGITYEDLINYFLLSKEKYTSFLLSSDTKKKETINRFSGGDIINPVFDTVDNLIKQTEKEIVELDKQESLFKGKLSILEDQLARVNEEVENKKQRIIEHIQGQLLQVKQKATSLEIQLQQQRTKINELFVQKTKADQELQEFTLNSSLESPELLIEKIVQRISELKNKIEDNRRSYQAIDSQLRTQKKQLSLQEQSVDTNIRKLNHQITENEASLAGKIQCPECLHEFVLNKDVNLDQIKQNLEQLCNELLNIKKQKEGFVYENHQVDEQITHHLHKSTKTSEEFNVLLNKANQEYQQILDDQIKLKRKKLSLEEGISSITSQGRVLKQQIIDNDVLLSSYDTQVKDFEQQIIEEEQKQYPDLSESIRNDIRKVQDQYNELINTIGEKHEQLRSHVEWKGYFKRFKTFLANQSVLQIQQLINHYLHQMKTPLSIRLDGFRALSDGSVKEEITMEVSRDGLETESIGKFSGGEKARIDLATILTMQYLINNNIPGKGFNMLWIDEILESVDPEGMNYIAQALSSIRQTILVIAHSQPNENIDFNHLIIEKINGISQWQKLSSGLTSVRAAQLA